jgi:hypothetical protein
MQKKEKTNKNGKELFSIILIGLLLNLLSGTKDEYNIIGKKLNGYFNELVICTQL